MLVWSVALALALRTYTESVMTAYYVWPALAVGLVIAARGSRLRFGLSIALAIGVTTVGQFQLELFQWWGPRRGRRDRVAHRRSVGPCH